MIAPATGIRQKFYFPIATFLAENGYGVICFDNRGIGESLYGSVNDSDASLVSWGRLDMTAALEELKKRFPNTSYHLLGHSAGGQLLGLMDNAAELSSIFNVACSSGSIRKMDIGFRIQAIIFMNLFIPASNFLFGHTKAQWFGMGDPLPRTVASQWNKWCSGEGYIKVDLDKTIHEHNFDTLSIPSLWLHATDDDIANLANVRDMIRVYPKLKAEIVTLKPKELGYNEIGHMKFFSSKKKELWTYVLDWLEKN